MKNYLSTHKRIFFLLYAPIYMIWFTTLEKWTDRDWTYIHCALDDATPFVPAFIIPYFLWFAFVGFFIVFFYFKMPASDSVRLFITLITGMTLTLIVYTLWPNALHLRPHEITGSDIFSKLCSSLYSIDTDTNVCPSLHVLNTLIITIAYFKTELHKKHHVVNAFIIILATSICFSTVFLKQHSYIDVFAAFGLAAVLYLIFYLPNWEAIFANKSNKKSSAA